MHLHRRFLRVSYSSSTLEHAPFFVAAASFPRRYFNRGKVFSMRVITTPLRASYKCAALGSTATFPRAQICAC